MAENNKIVDLYTNKSINFNNMDWIDILPWFVWFNFEDTKYLLSLLNKEDIKISLIEVFQGWDYYWWKEFFCQKDFFSDEYYNLLKDFVNYYENINNNDLQFIIRLDNEVLNEEIKTNLKNKFSPKISDEEKKERKKRWWEFLE